MNVDELKYFVDALANKWKSGAISPDEYNSFLASASMEYFKLKIGIPEEYQVGQYQSRQAYQVSQKITDDLRFLIEPPKTLTKNARGFYDLPTDYGAFSSLSYKYVVNNGCGEPTVEDTLIEVVTDGEYQIRKNNSIIPPTVLYPIAVFYSNEVLVLPKQITQPNLTYIRIPKTPIRAYTIQNDDDVYDPANSVQLEYPETTHYDIAYIILKMMGLNIRKEEIVAFANQRQKEGQ